MRPPGFSAVSSAPGSKITPPYSRRTTHHATTRHHYTSNNSSYSNQRELALLAQGELPRLVLYSNHGPAVATRQRVYH